MWRLGIVLLVAAEVGLLLIFGVSLKVALETVGLVALLFLGGFLIACN